MLIDYEQELTVADGELFVAANTYGDKPYDLKAAGIDPALGDPLVAFFKVVGANSDVGTSHTIAIVTDSTSASATAEVVALSKTVAVADLTTAKGCQLLGVIPPGLATKRYLKAKVTTTGTDATAGKLKIWLQKGLDALPQNNVVVL